MVPPPVSPGRQPACLPEQLLWSRVGRSPRARSDRAEGSCIGRWGPQTRSRGENPPRSSRRPAARTCRGSPPWEAQIRATSLEVRRNSSTPPASNKGSAWKGLAAERRKVGRDGSPQDPISRPASSTMAACPRCSDSTCAPRRTRARTGGAVMAALVSERRPGPEVGNDSCPAAGPECPQRGPPPAAPLFRRLTNFRAETSELRKPPDRARTGIRRLLFTECSSVTFGRNRVESPSRFERASEPHYNQTTTKV